MICNIDLATTVGARLSLHKFKDVEFFAQEIEIPAIQAVFPRIQGPRLSTAMPPQALEYSPLTVTYFLREDMSNHKLIVKWLQGSLYQKGDEIFSGGSVFTLNGQRQPTQEVKFVGLFPINISPVKYVTTAPSAVYQQATVVFDYLYYEYA